MKTYEETQIKRRKEEVKRRKEFFKLLDNEFYHLKFKCELLNSRGLYAELDINCYYNEKLYRINKKVVNNCERFEFKTLAEVKNFILNIEEVL